jgi:hypothetical protein
MFVTPLNENHRQVLDRKLDATAYSSRLGQLAAVWITLLTAQMS